MGRAQRQKGKRGEREVVRRFIVNGVPCRRDWESQSKPGGQQDGDLAIGEGTALEGVIYAEVRRRKRLAIFAWVREVAGKARGKKQAVIYREDGADWQASIPLDDYIDLLRRAYL